MGKRGQNKHLKRIAVPSSTGISNRKKHVWIVKPSSGPHNRKHAISLGILLREILKVCKTKKESRYVLNSRLIKVDGKVRTDEKFPVGLMDVVSFEGEDKHYVVLIEKHGRLIPVEMEGKETKEKIAKVTKKFTQKKGQLMITLHDGKTLKTDNNVKVGDSVLVSLPDYKVKKILKMDKGSVCFIKGGKHSGMLATVQEIMKERGKGEAKMKKDNQEFVTILDHLCVVDERIKGAA